MGLICPLGTFCPLGRFVPWDVLSLERFVLGRFFLGLLYMHQILMLILVTALKTSLLQYFLFVPPKRTFHFGSYKNVLCNLFLKSQNVNQSKMFAFLSFLGITKHNESNNYIQIYSLFEETVINCLQLAGIEPRTILCHCLPGNLLCSDQRKYYNSFCSNGFCCIWSLMDSGRMNDRKTEVYLAHYLPRLTSINQMNVTSNQTIYPG